MSRKDITIIVGSGAVENSWVPVMRAIKKTHGINTNRDGANFLMAREIYQLRSYSKFAQRNHYPEVFRIMKSNVDLLKQNIAYELGEAQKTGEIKARQLLKELVDKFTDEGLDRIAIVSTNWDEVIDIAINKLYQWGKRGMTRSINCYHIHGSINNPSTLYLPSEITLENYRNENEEKVIANNHLNFISLLRNNNKTILYGISLDPLDAELNVALAGGWGSKLNEEIIIINPNHEVVAERVKLLLDKKSSIKIVGYNPSNLNQKIEYK
nr:hypothetical protein [Allomuricauda sp.]